MAYDIEVTRIIPMKMAGSTKAFASISINRSIDINDLRIIQKDDMAPWVAMPSVEGPDGKRRPIVWLIDLGLKEQITEAVLAKWQGISVKGKPKIQRPLPAGRGRSNGSDQRLAEEAPPF